MDYHLFHRYLSLKLYNLNAKMYCKNRLTLSGSNYLYIYGRPGYSLG